MFPKNLRPISVLLFLLTLSATAALAQSERSFFLELAGGASTPIEKFAEKTVNTQMPPPRSAPGAARLGVGGQFTAGYHLKPSWGVLLSAGYSQNLLDPAYVRGGATAASGGERSFAETGRWKTARLMAGGFFRKQFAAGSKWRFQARLMAGASGITIPGYTVTTVSGGGLSQSASQITVSKNRIFPVFCYQFTGGIEYAINQSWYLSAQAAYFRAPLQQKIYYGDGDGFVWSPSLTEYKEMWQHRPVAMVNIFAGAGVRF